MATCGGRGFRGLVGPASLPRPGADNVKKLNWLVVAAAFAAGALLFGVGYWTGPRADVAQAQLAADSATARLDRMVDLHRAAAATADSLGDVVVTLAAAERTAKARVDSLAAVHVEAVATVKRLADEATGADGSGGKGEFSLAAWTEARAAVSVSDSLVNALRTQNTLLREQNGALQAQVEVLRASLSASDSLTAQAKKALDASTAARATLETALRRTERRAGVYKGLAFVGAGAAVTGWVLLAVERATG